MARVDVTTQAMALTGLAAALTGPTVDGDIVDVGRGFLVVNNGSGGSITVTIQVPAKVEDLAVSNRTVAVAAGVTKYIPLTLGVYKQLTGQANAGRALVDYSSVTSVTRAVIGL